MDCGAFGNGGRHRLKRKAADMAATKAFSGEPLEGVGGEVWRALWDSARRYLGSFDERGNKVR
jgi:hypothetical protein